MYIPIWLIIVIAIIGYFIYRAQKRKGNISIGAEQKETVDDVEENVRFLKERVFDPEPILESPHFIDVQNAFDAMEVNYLRLKQRFAHDEEKLLELAKDWHRYADALCELKQARVMLDVDWSDEAGDNFTERTKEPVIAKEEIEKKFKSLLGDDWQKIPPDYFERMDSMDEPPKEARDKYGIANDWKWYYRDSANLWKDEERRKKEKEKYEAEKQQKEENNKEQ